MLALMGKKAPEESKKEEDNSDSDSDPEEHKFTGN